MEQYTLAPRCRDGGQGSATRVTERTLRVVVLDVNDNAPSFGQQTYKGSIGENNYVGASVMQVNYMRVYGILCKYTRHSMQI